MKKKEKCCFEEDTNFNQCRNKVIGYFKDNDGIFPICKKHKERYNIKLIKER